LLDRDDLHLGSGSHPGGVVWSAVCACAGDAPVDDALAAASFGYELVVRLADCLAPERARWHSTAVAGIAGAAGAAAHLLGTDEADAVAHAVSVAGGSPHALVERTGTRFLHRAHAASSGVACARVGLPGSRGVLDAGRGAFAALDAEVLVASRPETCLEETSFRLHPATGFAHASIEAAQTLGPISGEIERVRVTASPPPAVALASNPAPATDDERWWSIEHAVAVALGAPELCSRTEVVAGGAGWAASVEVRLRDGSTRHAAVDGPRRASDDDLLEKWRQLTGDDGAAFFERLLTASGDGPFAALVSGALETR
jgi:2-methylcitrate dehydratase PrpD